MLHARTRAFCIQKLFETLRALLWRLQGLPGPHRALPGLVGPKSNFDRVAKRNLSHSKSTRVINVIKKICTEGMFELPVWRVFVYDLRIHTACCVETGLDKTDNTLTVSH